MTKHDGIATLYDAAYRGSEAATLAFINAGANVNDMQTGGGFSPLHAAILKANEHLVAPLIKAGADIRMENKAGETPLVLAAMKNCPKAIDILIGAGAEVDAESSLGYTPLYSAAWHGQLAAVYALIRGKACVNKPIREKKTTPLHIAALCGHADVIDVLVENGADVNARTDKQETPMHMAATGGRLAAVEALARGNADAKAKDEAGKTPMDLVRKGDEKGIEKYVKVYNALIRAGGLGE